LSIIRKIEDGLRREKLTCTKKKPRNEKWNSKSYFTMVLKKTIWGFLYFFKFYPPTFNILGIEFYNLF
jgi:hypothetical protein